MIFHKDWDINEEPKGFTGKGKAITGVTFQNGLNDIEPDGSFVSCDMGISEVARGVTYLEINRGRMGELRFGDSGHSNSFLVKIKNKALRGVSFKYTGADGESMTANNGKPLCQFDNGISIESTPYYKGVKMDIIVNDPLTAPLEYPFSIKTYGQDYNFIEENGGATLRGEDQEPIFIKPPYAVDASGDIGPVTIHYTGIENNLITFKKVVDETWLRQADAPVRIDPDITIEDGVDGGVIEDSGMNYGAINTNYGTHTEIFISNHGGFPGGESQSTCVRVALTGLSGFTPLNGKFIITPVSWNTSAPYDGKAQKLLKSFVESEVTWKRYKTGTDWDIEGAQEEGGGTPDRSATIESTFTLDDVSTPVDVNITVATLTEWLDTVNHGLLMRNDTGPAGLFIHAGSAEHPIYPIQFYIEYTEGGIVILRRRMEGH